MPQRVLVIDDDPAIRDTVRLNLQELNCEVETIDDGAKGLLRALEGDFQIIVLDLTLPGMSGFDVCKNLRAKKPHLPILMLTSRSSEAEVVLGLELGADDYLCKPFRSMELNARVRALLRRAQLSEHFSHQQLQSPMFSFGPLIIDVAARRAMLSDEIIELTAFEFDVLLLLSANAGRTISRDELVEQIWGEMSDVSDASINSLISRLRKKLRDGGADYISTLRGVGFRFDTPQE